MTLRFNWGTGIALFYGTFALATIGFVAFAMTKDVDLVTPEYYAQSLRHDERMTATANARALGEALSVEVQPGSRTVVVQWPADMAADVAGAATLYRPSSAALDRVTPLRLDARGQQQLSLEGLASGHWRVQLQWTAGGLDYYAERDIVAP